MNGKSAHIGDVYGKLTIIAEAEPYVYKSGTKKRWLCKCECGGETIATTGDLRRGHTNSCGCYQRRRTSEASKTHGMRHSNIYHRWLDMKQRCGNPKNKRYEDWGGRGIQVCTEWAESFESFYEYVSKLPHFGEKGRTIDRINNDGNYEPGNVRWANPSEQRNNQRVRKGKR